MNSTSAGEMTTHSICNNIVIAEILALISEEIIFLLMYVCIASNVFMSKYVNI